MARVLIYQLYLGTLLGPQVTGKTFVTMVWPKFWHQQDLHLSALARKEGTLVSQWRIAVRHAPVAASLLLLPFGSALKLI